MNAITGLVVGRGSGTMEVFLDLAAFAGSATTPLLHLCDLLGWSGSD